MTNIYHHKSELPFSSSPSTNQALSPSSLRLEAYFSDSSLACSALSLCQTDQSLTIAHGYQSPVGSLPSMPLCHVGHHLEHQNTRVEALKII